MGSLLGGISAYIRALGLIRRYGLWTYVWLPALFTVVLGLAILEAAWLSGDNIGRWLVSLYPWETGRVWVERIASVTGGLLVVVLGLMTLRYIVMALSSPFMSFLSEKLESRLYPHRAAPSFSVAKALSDVLRGLRIALRNVVRELFFTLLLLLLGVIIPILAPFVPILIFLLQSYYAGFGNMDYTLERRFGVRQSVRFVRRHRLLAIGNGAVFVLLLMTVVGFVAALPLGAVAAAAEVLPLLEEEEKIP